MGHARSAAPPPTGASRSRPTTRSAACRARPGAPSNRRASATRFCQAADVWESKLALLTEFLPDPGAPPRQVWSRIEQEIARSRISFSRPLLWPLAVAGLIVLAALLIAALAA
jgi:hypothetical protein